MSMPLMPPLLPPLSKILVAVMLVCGAGPVARAVPAFVEPLSAPTHAPQNALDVIFVPTPQAAVEAMLQGAQVGPQDVVYDLGSGDGRIPITAVRTYRARQAVGIDIDPDRIAEAEANRRKAGVGERVRFVQADLFDVPIGEATVVTLYLLPALNLRLLPKMLKELRPGTRVVSHAFGMGSWQPEKRLRVDGRDLYFWRIPSPGTPEHAAALRAAAGVGP